MSDTEKIVFSNSFGIVTDESVTIAGKRNSAKIPLQDISFIIIEEKKNIADAIFYFSIAVVIIALPLFLHGVTLAVGIASVILFAISVIAGVINCCGYHHVRLGNNKAETKHLKIRFYSTRSGLAFVNAIKKQASIVCTDKG